MCYLVLFLSVFFLSVLGCERSLQIRGVEDYCWTKNVEVIDRLQYTGKSILNFAKKKLGMEVERGDEPQRVGNVQRKRNNCLEKNYQNCDYYNCIFQELKMLTDGYPSEQKITTWIKNNVIYNHAMILLSNVDICSAGLSKSIGSNTFFSVETLENTTPNIDEFGKPLKLQGKCEIVAQYMKCMSTMDNSECLVFQHP